MGSGGHALGIMDCSPFYPQYAISYKICKESIIKAVKCNRKSKDKCIWKESHQKNKENKTLGYNHQLVFFYSK